MLNERLCFLMNAPDVPGSLSGKARPTCVQSDRVERCSCGSLYSTMSSPHTVVPTVQVYIRIPVSLSRIPSQLAAHKPPNIEILQCNAGHAIVLDIAVALTSRYKGVNGSIHIYSTTILEHTRTFFKIFNSI